MRVFVTTCDKYNWMLRPFSYLFNIYWSEIQEVVIGGYNKPDFDLPPNFTFHSIDTDSYPADRWSDGVTKFLLAMPDSHFVWMLEDMWLTRTVDHAVVTSLGDYARQDPSILRIDLSNDRLHSHDPRYIPDYDKFGRTNLIKSEVDWPYHMSLQAGIWERGKLLKILQPGWSAQECELKGSGVLYQHPDWKVLGTRQWPVQYTLTTRDGKQENLVLDGLPRDKVKEMQERGYF